jgi:transposase
MFPPVSTVQRYFYTWRNAGLLEAMNTVLVMNLREIEGREASPSAGVIDSQSVKTTKVAALAAMTRAKDQGRKRHILTDTCGFHLHPRAHRRYSGPRWRRRCPQGRAAALPWMRHVFADGGYAGDKLRDAIAGSGSGRSRSSNGQIRPRAFRFSPPVGCRANLCMARPMPPPGQGLGNHHRLVHRMGHNRLHPHAHAQNRKILLCLRIFRVRWGGCRPPQTASQCARKVVFTATEREGRQP